MAGKNNENGLTCTHAIRRWLASRDLLLCQVIWLLCVVRTRLLRWLLNAHAVNNTEQADVGVQARAGGHLICCRSGGVVLLAANENKFWTQSTKAVSNDVVKAVIVNGHGYCIYHCRTAPRCTFCCLFTAFHLPSPHCHCRMPLPHLPAAHAFPPP